MRRRGAWRWLAAFAAALVALASPARAAGGEDSSLDCRPRDGRLAVEIQSRVNGGENFVARTAGGWIVRLVPWPYGWRLTVSTEGREDDDLAQLTPPWHFTPNPKDIEGWHFRNRDNTGPNDGSVNAPGEIRDFIFSPEVGREIDVSGDVSAADVERVRAFGRGWLRLDRYRLTPPRPGARAAFEWLEFTACLTWPAAAGE